jgi:hypothetical protein
LLHLIFDVFILPEFVQQCTKNIHKVQILLAHLRINKKQLLLYLSKR